MPKRKKKKETTLILEIIGWSGVVSYILAYSLLVFGVLSGDALLFHAMYLFGAAGLIFHSYKKHDLQPVIVNVFFASVALLAIVKLGTI